ncbi:hypothetical protein EON81_04210 [bacterium]|nr:MAG: hypothetical protein EON81_04210 [bacterium]
MSKKSFVMSKVWAGVGAVVLVLLGAVAAPVATDLYTEWRKDERHRGTYQERLEKDLKASNVFLSGNESDEPQIRKYLQDDASFRMIADTVRGMVKGNKFRKPMHLNVINGKYRILLKPGGSPSAQITEAEAQDRVLLKQAIIDHWNEMYPEAKVASMGAMF